MANKQLHIATLRLFIHTESEVDAVVAADEIAEEVLQEYLDAEDGDRVEVTQVTAFTTDIQPTEILTVLSRARNALVRTRIKECYDEAKSLDFIIHHLRYRESSELLPPYDYGKFIEIAKSILEDNEDPL